LICNYNYALHIIYNTSNSFHSHIYNSCGLHTSPNGITQGPNIQQQHCYNGAVSVWSGPGKNNNGAKQLQPKMPKSASIIKQ
jgi:hypothetical protein